MTFPQIEFNTIDDLDVNKKYMIVGVRKSGTQSLKSYLIDKGFDVECYEGRFSLPEFSSTHDYSRIPIIIIRHLIDRTWSDYEFFKDHDPPTNPNGIDDSIEVSKYKKYVANWNNPILLTFDHITHLEGFPITNSNPNKRPLTKGIRKYLQWKLNYDFDHKTRPEKPQ